MSSHLNFPVSECAQSRRVTMEKPDWNVDITSLIPQSHSDWMRNVSCDICLQKQSATCGRVLVDGTSHHRHVRKTVWWGAPVSKQKPGTKVNFASSHISTDSQKKLLKIGCLEVSSFNVQVVPGIVINVYFWSMRQVFRFVLRFDVPFQIVHLFLRPVTHDLTRQILTVVEIKVRRAHCLIRTVSLKITITVVSYQNESFSSK